MIFYPTCVEATHVDFENETIDLKGCMHFYEEVDYARNYN